MDTISRENNSMLPIAGVIVGVLALLAGIYADVTVSKVKNQLADDQPRIDKVDDIAAQAAAASSTASQTKTTLDGVVKSTQDAFDQVGNQLGALKAALTQIQESQKHTAVTGHHHGDRDVVAGPGEYIIKPGDTGRKIAHANGCTVHELIAVNPGVNWSHLHLGQKIHLPQAKGDQSAPPAAQPPPS